MEAVHERAEAARVELGVRAFNESAQRFYASLGYAPMHIMMGRLVGG